jgi:hypothetical protein
MKLIRIKPHELLHEAMVRAGIIRISRTAGGFEYEFSKLVDSERDSEQEEVKTPLALFELQYCSFDKVSVELDLCDRTWDGKPSFDASDIGIMTYVLLGRGSFNLTKKLPQGFKWLTVGDHYLPEKNPRWKGHFSDTVELIFANLVG